MDGVEQNDDSMEMSGRPLAVSIQLHESLLASASVDGLTLPNEIFEQQPPKKNQHSGWIMSSGTTAQQDHQQSDQATAVSVKTTTERQGQVVFVENSKNEKGTTARRRPLPLHPTILTIEPSDNMNGNADESGTTTRIKDLGKKAKARLQEEKSKRPEIVVLHENDAIEDHPTQQSQAGGLFVPTPKPIAKTTKPRKRKTNSNTSSSKSKTQRRRDNDNVDDWMPEISHLLETEKDPQWSNIVQLHGVPTDCTMESIKRFFKGLSPERVLVLVPNRCRIDRLDSTEPQRRHRRSTILVPRHDPTELRVFCKFATAPTAALAKERSGETLMLLDNDDPKKKGAAIAVSQVEKKLGMALMNTLVSKIRVCTYIRYGMMLISMYPHYTYWKCCCGSDTVEFLFLLVLFYFRNLGH